MSTVNSNTIERSAAMDKFATTTFRVCKTGKSSFVKDGTGGDTGIPAQVLNTGKTLFVEPISRLYLGRGKGYMETQYVIGASTTYKNDYYEDKDGNLVLESLTITKPQAEEKGYHWRPGLRSLGYDDAKLRQEYGRSMELAICFEFGRLELSKYGDDPVLLRFIMEHEQNRMAPNQSENRDPKRLKLFMFEPLVLEMDAKKSKAVENFDEDLAAMQFVQEMRTKTEAGYKYDTDMLNAVMNILQEGINLGDNDVNQKFEIAVRLSKKDGATFMELVNGVFGDYRTAIAVGEQLGVLEFGATEVKLVSDNKRDLYTFKKASSKADCIKELTLFFLSGNQGQGEFAEMTRLTEVAKLNTLGPKKKDKK